MRYVHTILHAALRDAMAWNRVARNATAAKAPSRCSDLRLGRGQLTRISFFYGIAIYRYFEDHAPPHVHARYAGSEAKVSIVSVEVLEGSLPRRA